MAEKSLLKKESGVTAQERREVEVGTLLLDNTKSNVIAGKHYDPSLKYKSHVSGLNNDY